jgi:hypothetical protein
MLLSNAFFALTGCPVLINTSFNVRGEPIVCTPGRHPKRKTRSQGLFLLQPPDVFPARDAKSLDPMPGRQCGRETLLSARHSLKQHQSLHQKPMRLTKSQKN